MGANYTDMPSVVPVHMAKRPGLCGAKVITEDEGAGAGDKERNVSRGAKRRPRRTASWHELAARIASINTGINFATSVEYNLWYIDNKLRPIIIDLACTPR